MTAPGPRAINCTSCGAGLNVLGGGRVQVVICDFCGAALDASHDFEILAQYSRAQDLGSPFVPGMSGRIDGIDWVVIGSLQRSESWQMSVWTWYEHQLYSETHGYAWLSVEEGHLVFSRRMRGRTDPRFVSQALVERSEKRPDMRVMDNWIAYGTLDVPLARRRFKYHESGDARIDAAAGAFTWLPKVGETDSTVTLVRGDEALHCTQNTQGAREIVLSRYLPQAQVWESFGIAPEDRPPRGIHVLEPYRPWIHERFVKRVLGVCVGASLAVALYLFLVPASILASGQYQIAALPQDLAFDAPGQGELIQVRLRAYPNNGWAGFEVEAEGPEGDFLGSHELGIERYSGRDSDGAWTEGSSRGQAVLRPAAPGPHVVTVSYFGFEPWRQGSAPVPPNQVEVEIRAKRGAPRWPLIGAGVFALLFLAVNWPAIRHAKTRNGLSDWVDEEDDD